MSVSVNQVIASFVEQAGRKLSDIDWTRTRYDFAADEIRVAFKSDSSLMIIEIELPTSRKN